MEIVTINKSNLEEHPGVVCFINKKNPYHPIKVDWINQQLSEQLKIKLLYTENPRKLAGFIEYIPGEYAWRAVSAKGYLFIHCIWIYPNKNKNQGLGTRLVEECIKEAREGNYKGVAVVTSKSAFMAESSLFLKNGFEKIPIEDKGNELLALSFNGTELPKVNDWKSRLKSFHGLHIVYTKQCPWVARMVEETKDTALANKLDLQITELKTAEESQNAPSLYASFNLIYNGKLLADRYISNTRLKNILKKEKLI